MYGSENEQVSMSLFKIAARDHVVEDDGNSQRADLNGLPCFCFSVRSAGQVDRPQRSRIRVICSGVSAGSVGPRSAAASVWPEAGKGVTGFRAAAVENSRHESELLVRSRIVKSPR